MKNLIIGGSKIDNCEYALLHGCRILGCLIRKDIFFNNDLFYPEKTFFEDNAIAMSLLFSANEIKVVDKLLYYYQMVEGSSSRSISLVKIVDRIKTSDLAVSNLKRLGYINKGNKDKVDYLFLCFSYHTIRMLANVGSNEAKKYLSVVSERVEPLMPNLFLAEFHKDYIPTLKRPFVFYYLWKIDSVVKHYRSAIRRMLIK